MADVDMQDVAASGIELDTTADEILLAATNHDIETLQKLLKTGSANVQDADTGFTPLHAAIAACAPDDEELKEEVNGAGDAIHSRALDEEAALETVKLLFENGAIWNELDVNDETPGCLAHRLGFKQLYEAVVNAGVRAELLFNRLDDYEILPDGDEDEGAIEVHQHEEPNGTDTLSSKVTTRDSSVPVIGVTTESGEQTEPDLKTGAAALKNPNVNNVDYLSSELTYTDGRLLDEDKNAVMMDWEDEIMGRSVDALCPKPSLRTMNVGHGMGIVDGKFLAKDPTMHHIVEAHPAVIERMKQTGWYDKPNVTVHQGRWQDVLPKLVEEGVILDAIYYDTYAETYHDLKEFFSDYVISLLDPEGRFGFYNGLGADRQICYDVYTKVVEMDLFDAGMDVEWQVLQVPELKNDTEGGAGWKGIRRKYWDVDIYRLPTCKFVS